MLFPAVLLTMLSTQVFGSRTCDPFRELSCYKTYEYCSELGDPSRDCMGELITCLTQAGCVAP
jgi:hypothetical protein